MPVKISLAHSPDSDDAFMFYGLASGAVPSGDLEIAHVLSDIETLNQEARRGRHEVTAISVHAYAYVSDRYALMTCGGSIGDGYGPIVVAREQAGLANIDDVTVAVPGELTTAYLALRLYAPRARTRTVPFERILDEVASGRADAGLVIHEGQLTFASQGLVRLVDLGAWWQEQTGLPLPLGANAVRRDLGPALMQRLTRLVQASVEHGLSHRSEALDHALGYARGMERSVADRFVSMWVNDLTVDCGERGRDGIRVLLERGARAGVVPAVPSLDFVRPG